MDRSREDAGRMQLDDYVAEIARIYGAHDHNRSLWDVWCQALHHGAAVGERARKKAPTSDLLKETADFALWLFTVVHKLSGLIGEVQDRSETPAESLIRIRSGCSDLLWHRYPRFCPVCYERRTRGDQKLEKSRGFFEPCDCLLHDNHPQEKALRRRAVVALRSLSEETRSKKPRSIDEWQEMFGTVFRANLRQLSLVDATSHLMEELGETSDAMIRMCSYTEDDFVYGEPDQRQLRLEAQVADVFSWLFAVVEKIASLKLERIDYEQWRFKTTVASKTAVRLSEIIWRRYGSENLHSFWCPSCERALCCCPLIFVPSTRSIEELKALFKSPTPSSGKFEGGAERLGKRRIKR